MTGLQHIGVLISFVLFFPTIAIIIALIIQYSDIPDKSGNDIEKAIYLCVKIPAVLFILFEIWYWTINLFFFTKL